MAILKCKICGGVLAMTPDATVAECEYCGSMQTLPRVSDDRLVSFYERANDLRMSHEFDKALEIYEKIIEETPTDADAYWSMVLCRYGIDYVEEVKGGPRKPTINRAQMVSVFEDTNYRSAIKHADEQQKQIYNEEAARIDRILQRYLEISRKEPPYDVFICYKETAADGSRTEDSVRAGEIYRELTSEGFKVFFAPVTLENKLGEDYEPYIFAAIHSAKVMVVIGTKPEYMSAVWVKNEWSRFLTLAKEDSKKTLIPVYKNMDPYDMPEAFRFKQSQDMSKLGFMLDLVRGIEKLVNRDKPQKETAPAAVENNANVKPLLQRVAIFLDNQDWGSANIYCEKVLDINPTNGQAYVYKLLAEARVASESSFQYFNTPLEDLKAYKNAVRYADEATASTLISYNQQAKERQAKEREERLEAERLRREREQQEAQRRQEKARRDEEYRRKANALSEAINNASQRLAGQVKEKEQMEAWMQNSQDTIADQKRRRRKIIIPALIVLCIALIQIRNVIQDSSAGAPTMFIQIAAAIFLANARGKSKIGAFFIALLSVGLLPGISALRGLSEASKLTDKNLKTEQAATQSNIQRLNEQIEVTQKTLNDLHDKKRELGNSREDADI